MRGLTIENCEMNYNFMTTQQSYIFATEPLEDRVSAYEAAIIGKMPDVNVFKGAQTIEKQKKSGSIDYKASAPN